MARNMPESGEYTFIEEIPTILIECQENQSKSVRVTGRLDQHDACRCRAILTDPQKGCSVNVDTRLVEPFDGRKGSLFQVIGELENSNKTCDITLKARVMRCVDGIDLILFKQSVQAQRKYIKSREKS